MRVRAASRFAFTWRTMCTRILLPTRRMDSQQGPVRSFWSSCARSLRAIRQSHRLLLLRSSWGAHPKALAFVQTPRPVPSSFARETYFGVTAMRFTNKDGLSRFGRYRIVPEAGNDHLSDAATASLGANFLFDELMERVSKGPIAFRVLVQVANGDDVVNDATIHWPEDREMAEFGRIVLTVPVAEGVQAQKQIIFDPIPRVDGIDPSDDPLLELRAAVYLISGRRRRAASLAESKTA